MAFNPLHFRFTQAAIGSPEDARATDATSQWSMVALLKGIWHLLNTGAGGGGGGAGGHTDDDTFTVGADTVSVIGGLADESGPDAVNEGDAGAVRMTLTRALHVNLRNSTGTELAANSGAADAATLRTISATDDPAVTALQVMDDWDESNRAAVNLIAGQAGITADAGAVAANTPRVTLASNDPAVAALAVLTDWDETNRAKVNPIAGEAGVASGFGAVDSLTQRVVLGSDDPLIAKTADTGAVASASLSAVASSASSASLLASNASRKGVIITNTDANALYLKYGATAATTDFTVIIQAEGYWEMPLPIYTGAIDGIWAADGSGSAYITEL